MKKDKDGNFQKCKARWVLKGFQDKQKNIQQTALQHLVQVSGVQPN